MWFSLFDFWDFNLICTEPWSHNCIRTKNDDTLVPFSHKKSNSIYQLTITASLKECYSTILLLARRYFSNFLFDFKILTYGWFDEFDFFLQCNLSNFFSLGFSKRFIFFGLGYRCARQFLQVLSLPPSFSFGLVYFGQYKKMLSHSRKNDLTWGYLIRWGH